jgi:hypothetical protein
VPVYPIRLEVFSTGTDPLTWNNVSWWTRTPQHAREAILRHGAARQETGEQHGEWRYQCGFADAELSHI